MNRLTMNRLTMNRLTMNRPNNIISAASNIRSGDNPNYTVADFLALYPQFQDKVPEAFLEMYTGLANASLSYQRYYDAWEMVMGLFIAHFCTLYLQTDVEPESTAAEILAAGELRGLQASKSVGGVSISYDYNTALSGLDEWGGWTTTAYGAQFAALAKLYGKGGMQVW